MRPACTLQIAVGTATTRGTHPNRKESIMSNTTGLDRLQAFLDEILGDDHGIALGREGMMYVV